MTDTGGHLTTVPEITGKPKLDPVSVATTKLLLATGANSRSTRHSTRWSHEPEDAGRSSAGTLAG